MNGVYVVKMKFYVSHTNQLVIACKKSQGKKKKSKAKCPVNRSFLNSQMNVQNRFFCFSVVHLFKRKTAQKAPSAADHPT